MLVKKMIVGLKVKIYKLLRRSEKWAGTDMVYLTKNSFWLILSKTIGTITALALAIAYANLLPKEAYATYKYVISLTSLLLIATLPGINTALMRSVTLGFEGSVWPAIKTKFRWSLAGLAGSLAIAGYYFWQHNTILGLSFAAAAVVMPITNSLIYGPYLQGKKKFKTISIYNSSKQIASAAIIIAAIWLSPTALTVIFAYLAVNLFWQLLFFFLTFKKYPPNNKKDRQTIAFGKHLSLMRVMGAVAEQADKILMWHLLGPIQLAIYSFAILPVAQAQSMLKAIPVVAFPKIAAQDPQVTKRTLPKKVAKFTAILIIPVSVYILTAPYIYKFLFPQYTTAIKYSQFFALTLLFFPQRLFGQALTAYAQTKYLYIRKILNPLLKIIFYIALIYFFGIIGAIAAALLSSTVSGLTA